MTSAACTILQPPAFPPEVKEAPPVGMGVEPESEGGVNRGSGVEEEFGEDPPAPESGVAPGSTGEGTGSGLGAGKGLAAPPWAIIRPAIFSRAS